MDFKKITYNKFFRNLVRFFHLSNFSRKVYFLFFKPRSNKISISVGNISSDFYIKTPGELRVIESFGGGGAGEKDALEKLLSKLKEGDVVYDIGAHVGLYSIFIAKVVGKNGKVYSFEPEKQNNIHIRENIKINNLNNIEVINRALSDHSGDGKLFMGEETSNSSLNNPADSQAKYEIVKIVIGDEIVSENNFPIPKLVKIDVEGHEFSIIKGLGKTLSNSACKIVFCEIHTTLLPKNIASEDIYSILKSFGFSKIEMSQRDSEIHIFAEK